MIPQTRPTGSSSNRVIPAAKALRLLAAGFLLLIAAGQASAMEIKEWRFQTSLYTYHWSYDPDHVSNSKLLDLEFETTNKWIFGFGYFDNSFGQPSQYLYAGYSWPLFKTDWAYLKLTGGVLHGYKDPYAGQNPVKRAGCRTGDRARNRRQIQAGLRRNADPRNGGVDLDGRFQLRA